MIVEVTAVKIDDMKKLTRIAAMDRSTDNALLLERLREIGIDPNNFYQELEMSSPYVNTHRDISYVSTTVSLHSHTFHEVLYCRKAKDVEYLVGTERYRIQKGDIIFINPGVSHRPILPENLTEPYDRYVLWLGKDFIDLLIQMYPEISFHMNDKSVLLRTAGTKWEYLGEMFRSGIRENDHRSIFYESAILGNTLQLMSHIFRMINEASDTMEAETPELLDQIMNYIELHLQDRITLSETAGAFFVSESTISQLFKKRLGVSFYRFVTQRRLIQAKSLILEGVLLEDVKDQAGFSDYSTFYRAFKQEYGISPRQYRNGPY